MFSSGYPHDSLTSDPKKLGSLLNKV
jgi:hypothetical protein